MADTVEGAGAGVAPAARTASGRWDAATRGAFLAKIAAGENQATALRAVGMSDTGLRDLTRRDPGFAARLQDARDVAIDGKLARASADREASDAATMISSSGWHRRPKLIVADPRKMTAKQQQAFFATLGATANVSRAARAAGVSVTAIYARRRADRAFRLQWAATVDEAMVDLHLTMIACAQSGLADGATGEVPAVSERMALGLLGKYRPSMGGVTAEEITAPVASYAERKKAATAAAEKLGQLLDEVESEAD